MAETTIDTNATTVVPPADLVKPKAVAKLKEVKAKKPRKLIKSDAQHPKYADMITTTIKNLKDRRGTSRQVLLKTIMENYKVSQDSTRVRIPMNLALARGVTAGTLKMARSTGKGSKNYKIGEKAVKEKKPVKVVEKKPVKKVVKKSTKDKKTPKKIAKPKTTTAATKKVVKKPVAKKAVVKKTTTKPVAKKPVKKSMQKKVAGKKTTMKKPIVKKIAKPVIKKTLAVKKTTAKKTATKPTKK